MKASTNLLNLNVCLMLINLSKMYVLNVNNFYKIKVFRMYYQKPDLL